MADSGRAPAAVDCLLFERAGGRWLVPASLVAEVMAHFSDNPPETVEWRDRTLACEGDNGAVRALLVLRDLASRDAAFHALALNEPPRPCRVLATQLVRGDDGDVLLDGEPVRLFQGQVHKADGLGPLRRGQRLPR